MLAPPIKVAVVGVLVLVAACPGDQDVSHGAPNTAPSVANGSPKATSTEALECVFLVPLLVWLLG